MRIDGREGSDKGKTRSKAERRRASPAIILSVPSASSRLDDRFGRRNSESNAGQELAPAFTNVANRLLWRRRARPSATLDKMRTKL